MTSCKGQHAKGISLFQRRVAPAQGCCQPVEAAARVSHRLLSAREATKFPKVPFRPKQIKLQRLNCHVQVEEQNKSQVREKLN